MVTLSDEGRTASKGWTLVTLPEKEVSSMQGLVERWEVPLAIKKFVAITNVFQGND
jgi:hypothetical protein